MHSPSLLHAQLGHWNAVIHILKYIKGSLWKGLLYSHNNYNKVVCYLDVDWVESLFDRRSISRYCGLIGDNLSFWKTKKQHVVARSSAEADYRAMTSATYELIWLKHLLKKLQFRETTQMTLM